MRFLVGAAALGALGASACTFWYPKPNALQAPVPAHRAVQVWSGGKSYDLHDVTVQRDTVRGSTNWTTLECDTCVVALAVPAVDSVKVKRVSIPATMLFSLTALATITFVAIRASLGGPGS